MASGKDIYHIRLFPCYDSKTLYSPSHWFWREKGVWKRLGISEDDNPIRCSMLAPLSTPPTTPKLLTAEESPSTTFDIVASYNSLIESDPNITPPIAAIESLINLLATSPLTTISETLALLSSHSRKLLESQRNPIPLSAGTELFQRYLISSFQQRPSSLATSDFSALRHHIIAQSSLFVKRANEARLKIAHHALPFIIEGSTFITYGYSRVVHAVLTAAAESKRYFNVIYVLPSTGVSAPLANAITSLHNLSISTTTIPLHALTYALASLPPSPSSPPQFLIGATAVLENGSIVTELGTHQIGLIAQACSIPLHVCVESYKFVGNFPLGYGPSDLRRMGVEQDVLRFSTTSGTAAPSSDGGGQKKAGESSGSGAAGSSKGKRAAPEDADDRMVEITPPELISALITENGIMTPNAVSEELIKLWF
ncbi:uncharacterized protein A1O5_01431 [Cladophialophora psammophila CBS 110553]|uniref:Translation initiation factor eIF2B subunit alpha n=1 Tax=Cladophialophora psammophila CBS 110553 TaxID=1182543 RepID=W9XCS0_9EURO|nr:uncharacterized protein A1O5_01431 [Cladophialophora psammophila CBS 110553]EXJ74736.1 hypothetical protein A1O5_01431 [Cladophialophora psammophila CBS 110553]